ncbi:MAG: DUF2218 domain-containing protein [Pseudomonadota bacterium]
MLTAEASVSISTPARYMGRLCKHFAHRVAVHQEADRARIEFPGAPCSLRADAERLEMRLEAEDAATLERLQEVVTRHLKQVAPGEQFEVSWHVTQ